MRHRRIEIMTRHSLALFAACAGALAAGCFGPAPTQGGGDDVNSDPACQLHTQGEKTPGYPYSVDKFTTGVLPVVTKNCANAGCHGAPSGTSDFTVWVDAAAGNCSFGKTFNSVIAKVDLTTPANSQLLSAVTGGDPAHPLKFTPGSPEVLALSDFINDASKTNAGNGGGTTP